MSVRLLLFLQLSREERNCQLPAALQLARLALKKRVRREGSQYGTTQCTISPATELMEEVQLLSAMWFPLFPTADTAVSYFVSECFNISQPSPMYISTTGEGQGETREATNKTDLGLKRQSQFSMYNLTARKVDANKVPRADTNPSLCKVS